MYRLVLCVSFLCSAVPTIGQQGVSAVSSSDPVLQVKSPAAVTLSGSVTQTIGTKQTTGSVVLKVAADGSYTEAWDLSTGQRTYQASASGSGRSCSWTDSSGNVTLVEDGPCTRIIPWFAPWGAAQLVGNNAAIASVATSTASVPARLFQLSSTTSSQSNALSKRTAATLQTASAVTIEYDPATNLPTRSIYKLPLSNGSSVEIAVEYSDYRNEGGYMLPHHLVRSIQHTVELDLQISSVTLN